jgi:DNA-binding MarR family transcriptional regulator
LSDNQQVSAAHSTSDLTEVDRRILRALDNPDAHAHGVLSMDLAPIVGVPPSSMGSRLSGLAKRGWIEGYVPSNAYSAKAWSLTEAGVRIIGDLGSSGQEDDPGV